MRIKVDEDLPRIVTTLLNAHGHDAVSVFDQHLSGSKDPDLWDVVQAESRFLVTADKGFGDIRCYPPGHHAGVLVLRPDEDGIRPLVDLLKRVLHHYDLTTLAGMTTIASPRSIRIRRD
jgi:predicted nuclease of predicted toxin-antitoxin system